MQFLNLGWWSLSSEKSPQALQRSALMSRRHDLQLVSRSWFVTWLAGQTLRHRCFPRGYALGETSARYASRASPTFTGSVCVCVCVCVVPYASSQGPKSSHSDFGLHPHAARLPKRVMSAKIGGCSGRFASPRHLQKSCVNASGSRMVLAAS